jgi:AcrR family transcriptional regulator
MSKEETRFHILSVASRLFIQNGFIETSMNDIVRETGLSKGGIYWHFKSKDEIVTAIFDQYFEGQIERLIALEQENRSVSDRIRSMVIQIGADLQELGQTFPQPLEFYSQAARDPALLELLKSHFASYEKHLSQLIQQGIDRGEYRSVDPILHAHVLLSSLEGLILVRLFSNIDIPFESRLTTAVEILLRGLAERT